MIWLWLAFVVMLASFGWWCWLHFAEDGEQPLWLHELDGLDLSGFVVMADYLEADEPFLTSDHFIEDDE